MVPAVGILKHEFIQIVQDGAPCGTMDGQAWGFQRTERGVGRVEPEQTPDLAPMLDCREVKCIDEKGLLQDILSDLQGGPMKYTACHAPWSWLKLPWNSDNCQGWVDRKLANNWDQKDKTCCGP